MDFTETYHSISHLLQDSEVNSDNFAVILRREKIPHLSFSQVTTVEFCPYRYYRQYVALEEPSPVPDYFTKGKLLHRIIADSYMAMQNGRQPDEVSLQHLIAEEFKGDNYNHLVNALQVHRQNVWQGYEVLGIEHSFVMQIAKDLPPLVGVIDLVLKGNGGLTLVDHKTGRNFYPYDDLQVAIYAKYLHEVFSGTVSRLFYDHYRWVNNLGRIRKPAFQRTEVSFRQQDWPEYLGRIRHAYEKINNILRGGPAEHNGECFRCPYRYDC